MFPIRKKTTFVSSFGDNIYYSWEQVVQLTDHEAIILNTNGTHYDFGHQNRTKILNFHLLQNPISFIRGIYHLATSKFVFIDNYYGFLSATSFRDSVKCIQLWHANGAVKKFGLEDPSIRFRSRRAYDRFLKVYNRFHYIVVGSKKMEDIYKEAFAANDQQFLRTGIPRTDLFFNQELHQEVKESIKLNYNIPNDKKVILYAPTFRDTQLKQHSIKLNINKVYQELKDDYVLLLRLHPAILKKYNNNYPEFIIDVSDYPELNHLLFVCDYLITDYSSIPFEFSLLEKPMIFYPYDLEEYAKTRGFWARYEELVPGPIAKQTDELIDIIKNHEFNMDDVKRFSNEWNEFNDGQASEKLVNEVYKK
ncbi:CDP-glycerol glycerophosphotransferase family protein [Aquisalibacillus elongatus]|uniref:CDP-glycerol glycerophosphotransferase family protein n=1 Tax=Aquisalibacillus elongatus TaxID=485577 RepID=UPI00147445F7|nr:CDP-glycerol glycerophosphotransferase family protein [Aquisalibacillus elongatus]